MVVYSLHCILGLVQWEVEHFKVSNLSDVYVNNRSHHKSGMFTGLVKSSGDSVKWAAIKTRVVG